MADSGQARYKGVLGDVYFEGYVVDCQRCGEQQHGRTKAAAVEAFKAHVESRHVVDDHRRANEAPTVYSGESP